MEINLELKDYALSGISLLLGILASYLVHRWTRKDKLLVGEVLPRQIVAENFAGSPFKISLHNGKIVDCIYLVPVRFWNRGGDTIRGSDISRDYPASISIDESIEIVGHLRIKTSDKRMSVSCTKVNETENKFVVEFDWLNENEWIEIGFLVSGDPHCEVALDGRICGQKKDFSILTDGSRASAWERINSGLFALLIVTSPVSLIASWVIVFNTYGFASGLSKVLFDFESLSQPLSMAVMHGLLLPFMYLVFHTAMFIKRRRHPKGYKLPEDYEPSSLQALDAYWATTLTGRKHHVSNMMKNKGEIMALGKSTNPD